MVRAPNCRGPNGEIARSFAQRSRLSPSLTSREWSAQVLTSGAGAGWHSLGDGAALPVALATPPKCGVRRCANPVRPRPALSEHSIKAARHAAKYNLVSRILEATSPNAGARGVAPRDALGLRFRHTAIDACLVTVGAFYQTHRKSMSLPLQERRFLGNRERHGCCDHNPKDQQRRHHYFAKIRHYPKGRTDHRPASITFPRGAKRASSSWLDGDRSKDTFSAFC